MQNHILYSFRRCPYAIRARMAISYSNLEVELREISLKNRPKEMYEVSAKGTVPVLITKNKKIIDESLDIMIWAINKNKKQNLLNNKNELELISSNDFEFKQWLDKYKYHVRFPDRTKEFYREKCCYHLNKYEKILSKNKYLFGDSMKITDLAIFPFVRQFAFSDIKWFNSNYNHLSDWLNEFIDSSLFNSVMHKFEVWDSNKKPFLINFNNYKS